MTLLDPPIALTPTADVLRRWEDEPGVEFADGAPVEKPMSREAERTCIRLARVLDSANRGEAEVYGQAMIYRVYPEQPRKFRKPDLSAVRVERLAGLGDFGELTIPADLVVEVISPGDLAYDVAAKTAEYLAHGFGEVWNVYPLLRAIEVHRADGSVSKLGPDDEITGGTVLPHLRCKVADLFPPPARP